MREKKELRVEPNQVTFRFITTIVPLHLIPKLIPSYGVTLDINRFATRNNPQIWKGKGLTCIWWLLETATFEIIWGSKGNDLYVAEMTPKVFPLPHRTSPRLTGQSDMAVQW